MLSLKCYQCLGYHISVTAIPKPIVEFIAKQLEVDIDKENLQAYMKLSQCLIFRQS